MPNATGSGPKIKELLLATLPEVVREKQAVECICHDARRLRIRTHRWLYAFHDFGADLQQCCPIYEDQQHQKIDVEHGRQE